MKKYFFLKITLTAIAIAVIPALSVFAAQRLSSATLKTSPLLASASAPALSPTPIYSTNPAPTAKQTPTLIPTAIYPTGPTANPVNLVPKQASTLTTPTQPSLATPVTSPTATAIKCDFTAPVSPAKPEYKAKFLAIKKPATVQPGEFFNMQIFVQNMGNIPWFSEGSGCNSSTIVHLGTEKERDRISPFYTTEQSEVSTTTTTSAAPAANTWSGPSRIKLNNKRVSPLELASFTITAKAPLTPGVYREFYAPVAEGVQWMDGEALFSADINVGSAAINPDSAQYLTYIQKSTNLSDIKLDGAKNIQVDLSEQRMYVNIGDTTIRTFPVSSGAPKHPTPKGTFKIFLKQPVRIAGSSPHYIMPLFQMFKPGGYGIHALPSLGNDNGVFWREALNHIGSPRSHGCVRLLPDDAQFVFDFTEMGTEMTIQR